MRDCRFPGQCLMLGDHLPAECHTAEMVEQYENDAEGTTSLSAYMDYLTHDVEAADWSEDIKGMVCQTPLGSCDLSVLVFDPYLSDPQKVACRSAYVWRLIERFGDAAVVKSGFFVG